MRSRQLLKCPHAPRQMLPPGSSLCPRERVPIPKSFLQTAAESRPGAFTGGQTEAPAGSLGARGWSATSLAAAAGRALGMPVQHPSLWEQSVFE